MDKNCEKCVQYPGPKNLCPAWIRPENGFIETNVATGEERIVQGCFYQVIPKLMSHVVAASNRPAAAFESMRNEINTAITVGLTNKLIENHNGDVEKIAQ